MAQVPSRRCFRAWAAGSHWLKSPATWTVRAAISGAASKVTDTRSEPWMGVFLTMALCRSPLLAVCCGLALGPQYRWPRGRPIIGLGADCLQRAYTPALPRQGAQSVGAPACSWHGLELGASRGRGTHERAL